MMDFVAGDTEEPFKEKETVPFRAVFVTPSFFEGILKISTKLPKNRISYTF